MFPNLIEDLSDGAVDHDYDLLFIEGRKSVRKDIASTQGAARLLTIRHDESGTGINQTLNSVARLDEEVSDADGNMGTLSAYVVIRNPLRLTTAAVTAKLVSQLTELLTDGTGAARLINGEI